VGNKTYNLGLPAPGERMGSLIVARLDGGRRDDIVVTQPGVIAGYTYGGRRLWRKNVDIQLTAKAEDDGLPGLHAPGAQAMDLDGDNRDEILFLTKDNVLHVIAGGTGAELWFADLPPPPSQAERWEHFAVATFRGQRNGDILLQATNKASTGRRGRFLAAYRLADLRDNGFNATELWSRDDFAALAHSGARIADLDGDGRHEVIGADIIGPDGSLRFRLNFTEKHLDSVYIADVRPDLPGLEVVGLGEGVPSQVYLYNHRGLIWKASNNGIEPQNAAVGDFDPNRPGLEIWLRSRFDTNQKPWVFDSRGNLIASYVLNQIKPAGWTTSGVEEIWTIHWTGGNKQLAAAKERHTAGDVAIFDPMTGEFLLRLDLAATRLYVADVRRDWREDIVVRNGDQIRFYWNRDSSLGPKRNLWAQDHYFRSKQIWNYYNP
jgi:hypothetical protein